jgi:ribose transport system substrate-binding protein
MKKIKLFLVIGLVLSVFVLIIGCSPTTATETTQAAETTATETTQAAETTATETTQAAETETTDEWVSTGPNGEPAVSFKDANLVLTDEEKETIKKENYGATFMWFSGHVFFDAIESGAKSVFEELNIDVVGSVDTGVDVAKVKDNIETLLALNPKILMALALDPVSASEAFRSAVDAGLQLSFLSNVPNGYKLGEDYAGVVGDDNVGMGLACAEMMSEALGGKGKIGFLYGDMGMWVTEQRDGSFKKAIQEKYPEIEIVAEAGIADYSKANEIIAGMLVTNPEIEGLYVVTDNAMGGVLAALREANRQDVKVITIDIGLESAIDMAKGQNVYGIVADYPYQIGEAMAMCSVYGILEKETPAFVTVDYFKITKDNLLDGWKKSLMSEPPNELKSLFE